MRTIKRHIVFSMAVLASVLFASSCLEDPMAMELAPPTVSLGTPAVKQNSALIVCNVEESNSIIKDCGFYYSMKQDMSSPNKMTSTIDVSHSFKAEINGLTAGTTYYYIAFLSNGKDEMRSPVGSFMTLEGTLPIVETMEVFDVGEEKAGVKSGLKDTGGMEIIDRGVCWSTKENPTISEMKVIDKGNEDIYYSSLTDLIPGTQYYVRSFATNGKGTGYGGQKSFTTVQYFTPTVVTDSVRNIKEESAEVYGTIISDGGVEITGKGICWGKSDNPTLEDHFIVYYGDEDVFKVPMDGLTANTKYYVRCYATNSKGTSYGDAISFTTKILYIPDVVTVSITEVGEYEATITSKVESDGGDVITDKGVCWSTVSNPTINNDKKSYDGTDEIYTIRISDLTRNTKYYIRSYATNAKGTGYSEENTLITLILDTPTVVIDSVANINETTADIHSKVISNGNLEITERGICWGTSENPTVDDHKVKCDGNDEIFIGKATGLTKGTSYHARAYATNAKGTGYSADQAFKTIFLSAPTVTTSEVTAITSNSAKSGGNVTGDGGMTVTARGVCWSTSPNPTKDLPTKTSDGTGKYSFVSEVTSLQYATKYYLRAYATNSLGTSYGEEREFTTSLIPPTVSITNVTDVSVSGATINGKVENNGGGKISGVGIYWGTSEGSVTNKISISYQNDDFSVPISGLEQGKNYYVKAYAENSIGKGYSDVLNFRTLAPPTITSSISEVTKRTITVTSTITSDNGYTITEKGISWGTSPDLTYYSDENIPCTDDSNPYELTVPDLTPGARYYVRAYAISECGIGYSEILDTLTLYPWYRNGNVAGADRRGAVSFTIGNKAYLGTGSFRNDFWEYDSEQNIWTQKADYPAGGVNDLRAFSIDGKGYVGLGYLSDGTALANFYSYDPNTNAWTRIRDYQGNISSEGGDLSAAFSVNGRGYICGDVSGRGYSDYTETWEFNPDLNTWTKKANMPSGNGISVATAFSIGNKGYVQTWCAWDTSRFLEYDPATNIWIARKYPPIAYISNVSSFVINEEGYIVSGWIYGQMTPKVCKYNPVTDTWTICSDFPSPRLEGIGFAINGKGYFGTGGRNGSTDGSKDFWIYDPSLED